MERHQLLKTPSRSRRGLRRERGASVVEVALSMILLVPAVLYAIYAGESFLAATRAQEAEITASWDITGYLLHDYINAEDYESGPNGEPSHYREVTQRAARRVARELGRMNSYYATGEGGQRMVISQQRMRGVDCRPHDVRGVFNNALLTFQSTPVGTRQYLHRGGYVVCTASVDFSPQFMPRRLRDGYSAKVDLLSEVLANGFTICGNGRSLWGCDVDTPDMTRGVVVLTNDWGLENGESNPVGSKENAEYHNVGESVFRLTHPQDPGDKAGGIGTQQINEALQFLLDENGQDWGDTSTFKFGFHNRMGTQSPFPANGHGSGQAEAHMSPWEDAQGGYRSAESVHDQRDARNYLGHETPGFLDTPQ